MPTERRSRWRGRASRRGRCCTSSTTSTACCSSTGWPAAATSTPERRIDDEVLWSLRLITYASRVPFPRKFLNDGEDVVLDLHPHWWFFAKPVSTLVLLLVGVGFAYNIDYLPLVLLG